MPRSCPGGGGGGWAQLELTGALTPQISKPWFPSPEFFAGRIKWYGASSAEFIFFSSDSLNCAAIAVVPRKYNVQIVLNTLWNSYLNQATKNVYIYIYIYNCQIFLSPKKSRNEKFQNKKYHLGNFNSPLPLQPPPWAGSRVKHYCLRCSFWLLEVVRHLSPSLYFSWFLSVCGKYLLQLIFISSWILFFLCFCVC